MKNDNKNKNKNQDDKIKLIETKSKGMLNGVIRFIGVIGIPAIITLVLVITFASRSLSPEQNLPVVTLVSSAVVSITGMLQSIINIKRDQIKNESKKEDSKENEEE